MGQGCEACFYWSALIAKAQGGGPVEAVCLNEESEHYQKYTSEAFHCLNFEESNGPHIDEPL